MKKRAARTALIVLELFALLLAVGAAGAAYMYWRLGQGPVSLDLFGPSAVFAIERQLPAGYAVEVGALELSRAGARGDYLLTVSDLSVTDEAGAEAAAAPEILFLFSAGDFFSGAFGPRSIVAEGARFAITRNARQTVEIPAAPVRRRTSGPGFLTTVLDRGLLKSAFEEAALTGAEVVFTDAASGRSWTAPDAEVLLRRDAGGLTARLAGDIDMDGVPAAIEIDAQYTEESGVVSVTTQGENFPVGDVLSVFYGENAAILDAPVTGRASILFSDRGAVLSSNISARVGAGHLTLGGVRRPVSFIEWRTGFDPAGNDFDIERLAFDVDGSKGVVSGAVRIAFGQDVRRPLLVLFDLKAEELVVDAKSMLPAPVPVETLSLAGAYQVQDRHLRINDFKSAFLDVAVEGGMAFVFSRPDETGARRSTGVKAELTMDGALDPERLLRIWPRSIAAGARDWIEDRLETATIRNVRALIDLPPGAVAEDGGLPDEAINVTFDISGAKAHYIEGMTPLVGGSGSGVLRGNSFLLKADAARVGAVSISAGEIDFPVFMPKWQPTYMRFTATGRSEDILAVLDEEPLVLLSKVDLSPDQFSGAARVRAEIMRPNKRDVLTEEYEYDGTAEFENMTVRGLAGDLELSGGAGTVDLKTRSMTVKADALLGDDAPINLVWEQNFFEEDGPSSIAVSGEIDSSTGDLFGIPSRQFLHGPIAFSARATGELGAIETLDINADFTDAALTIDVLGWRKPPGSAAAGDLAVSFDEDIVSVKALTIAGDGVEISGALQFAQGGVLQSAHLPKVFLEGAADFSLSAAREPSGVLDLTTVGEYLNVAPVIEQIVGGPAGGGEIGEEDLGPGFALTSRIERLAMRNDIEYRAAALDFRQDADDLQLLDFSAIGRGGAPLRVVLSHDGDEDGPSRFIEARTSAMGDLLAGVFDVSSISGGEGSMRVHLPEEDGHALTGVLEARDLQVVEAPLLARIFSAGSLDGLSNLLGGKGIDFSYAYGEFDFADSVVSIRNARATGSSVGITAEGGLATGEGGEISLVGAVAPVYQLNSALANAPIIGDILVGRKGEGILALSYAVSGATDSPSVFVNPLSALTPGVFRQLMQPPAIRQEAPAAPEPPTPED